ncbi:hypothetical protein [Thermaerobacillus caldiproteolyticus]|nr:hypothetical protein [Anoxybacillus caldiproteolyticus]QPA31351.1 hypothetical protein ISX45_18190 [Anoxybacillus caldiproteolyticus]
MKYRVYDERTNETLFESDSKFECYKYLYQNFDESDEDFPHVWLEEFKQD